MAVHYIAWWNLENLFDIENAPGRSPTLQQKLQDELQGWTNQILQLKLERLALVVRQMNEGRGPDVLGVCEVENSNVLQMLIQTVALGRNYKIAHEQMNDPRGIDVAFIYDADMLRLDHLWSHRVELPFSTRDILHVNFTVLDNDSLLVLVGNHWPSRSNAPETRQAAGNKLAYWVSQIQYYHGQDAPMLIMGDFNDEPFDTSVYVNTKGRRRLDDVLHEDPTRLYNLMWPIMGVGDYTYVYDGYPLIIDQFLVSRGLLDQQSPMRLLRGSARTEIFNGMVDNRPLPRPIRFSRPSASGGHNPNGFSDHLPLSVVVESFP